MRKAMKGEYKSARSETWKWQFGAIGQMVISFYSVDSEKKKKDKRKLFKEIAKVMSLNKVMVRFINFVFCSSNLVPL